MRRAWAWLALYLGCAAAAQAGSLNLRWNDCYGDGGAVNRMFACDTNSGSEMLVGSFLMPQDLSNVVGNEIVVDVGFPGSSLPAWWDFKNAGTCRPTSLAVDFVPPLDAAACVDWAGGQGVGGVAAYTYTVYPGYINFTRIKVASATLEAMSLSAGQEYFSFRLFINHQKTVGTGSCSGCLLGACIYFRNLKLTTPNPQTDLQLYPGYPTPTWQDALATWQGGEGVVELSNGTIVACHAATPTRNRTWGEVKSLYR